MEQLALLAGTFPQDQLAGRRVQSVQPVPTLLGRLLTEQPPNLGPLRELLRCARFPCAVVGQDRSLRTTGVRRDTKSSRLTSNTTRSAPFDSSSAGTLVGSSAHMPTAENADTRAAGVKALSAATLTHSTMSTHVKAAPRATQELARPRTAPRTDGWNLPNACLLSKGCNKWESFDGSATTCTLARRRVSSPVADRCTFAPSNDSSFD